MQEALILEYGSFAHAEKHVYILKYLTLKVNKIELLSKVVENSNQDFEGVSNGETTHTKNTPHTN